MTNVSRATWRLPVMAASLLTDQVVELRNVPDIEDIGAMALMLQHLGVDVERLSSSSWRLQARALRSIEVGADLTRRMRGSFLLFGALIARTGDAAIAKPGGDDIGMRRVEQHLEGLRLMGAQVEERPDMYAAHATRLRGAVRAGLGDDQVGRARCFVEPGRGHRLALRGDPLDVGPGVFEPPATIRFEVHPGITTQVRRARSGRRTPTTASAIGVRMSSVVSIWRVRQARSTSTGPVASMTVAPVRRNPPVRPGSPRTTTRFMCVR